MARIGALYYGSIIQTGGGACLRHYIQNMKAKDIYRLNKGDKVNHKHYGICIVDDVIPDFGVNIIPVLPEDQEQLKRDADTVDFFKELPLGTPLLEISFRLLSKV